MQKLVIDTNVLVSGLIQRSYPFHILKELFFNDNLRLCISDEVFEEYFEVLNRKKFSRFTDFIVNAQALLVSIEKRAIKFQPTVKVDLIKDLNDNKFLELSETCNANFLVTGNTQDFTFKEYKGTKIVTPKEYWITHLPK